MGSYNVESYYRDYYRGDDKRVGEHRRDALHIEIIHEPAWVADKVEYSDYARVFYAQSN